MVSRVLLKSALPGLFPGWRLRLRDLGLLGLRLLVLLPAYSLSRVFFALLNPAMLAGADRSALAQAFWMGIRFDVSTVLSVNAPFILLSLLPFPGREGAGWRKGLKVFFVVTNGIFLLFDLSDAEYARYTGRRTGADVLGILPDVAAQLPQMLVHFWYVPLGAVALIWCLWKLYAERYRLRRPRPLTPLAGVLAAGMVVALTVLGIRGSVDLRPLTPSHAYGLRPSRLGTVALNTPFVFFKSLQAEAAKPLRWAGTPEQARAAFRQAPGPQPPPQLAGYNVVVILLESFGTEYTGLEGGKVYTPFLDSLAHVGTWMPHFYANGRRSIEALPAVLAQLPSLEEEAFITGPYASDRINGWAEVAGRAGYQTAFFHGGRNGTMGFDAFSAQAGFGRYVGLDQYPQERREADYDGNWGIYDRPFLQFVAGELGRMRQPFVAGLFTLSSHQPYAIEPSYANTFDKGTLPIHESLGYADMALRQFFSSAQKQPWFSKTLFVLTADHTQMSQQARFQTPAGMYDVPCIFFAPGRQVALDTAQVRQHADIGPTVLDLLGLRADSLGPFASSMARQAPSRVLVWGEGRYTLIERLGYARLSPEGRGTSSLPPSDTARAFRLLKAGTEAYVEGLRGNRLYW